jgi:TIR domain-containing protein/pentapeptide repeat protein
MAIQEHLDVLNQGKSAWNAWRKVHASLHPDLSGADLRKRMLRSLELADANLSGADLRDANLRRADLTRARLNGAKLYRAFFSGATLDQTSFKGAVLYETVFADVDLSSALHLDECVHKGPSVLDHRTLDRSKGLSRDFLRGCGLPDDLIEEALGPEPRFDRFWSCFISYADEDKPFVERLYAELQGQGVRCWFAPADMRIGAKIRSSIDEAIRGNEKVLLVLSEHSIVNSWVEKETETAFEEEATRREPVLFPIRLDDSPMEARESWIADIRRSRHIGDFSRWRQDDSYKAAVARLLRDLQRPDR